MYLGWCREPYPDELLYGYICCIFRKNGYHNIAQINQAIKVGKIGVNNAVGLHFISDLIENKTFPDVEHLIQMLPVVSCMEAEYALQQEKTCFPKVKTKAVIRVCPECMKYDIQMYGEALLHLCHHRESKWCPIHGCNLHWMPSLSAIKEIKPFSEYDYSPYTSIKENEKEEIQNPQYIWSLCNICGKRYLEHQDSITRGTGCPYCNAELSSEEIAQNIIDTLYNKEYKIIESDNRLFEKVVEHIPCGSTSVKVRKLLSGKQFECKECQRLLPRYLQRRFDPKEIEWVFKNTDERDIERRRICVFHKVCGTESFLFMSQYTKKEGGYCPVCDNPQKQIQIHEADPEYEISGKYCNNRKSIQIRHKICGVVFRVSKTSFLAGARCPICTPRYNFEDVKIAVEECCQGWKVKKEAKRGMVSVISPSGEIKARCSYSMIMAELKAGTTTIFPNRFKRWTDPVSIRKRIYNRIAEATRNKGYWNFADGLDEVTDSSMPGGVSRERRNIVQDMAKEGFIERCGRGCYRVVK